MYLPISFVELVQLLVSYSGGTEQLEECWPILEFLSSKWNRCTGIMFIQAEWSTRKERDAGDWYRGKSENPVLKTPSRNHAIVPCIDPCILLVLRDVFKNGIYTKRLKLVPSVFDVMHIVNRERQMSRSRIILQGCINPVSDHVQHSLNSLVIGYQTSKQYIDR